MSRRLGWLFKVAFVMSLAGTMLATVGGIFVFWFFSRDLPKIITVEDYRPLTVTRILGAGGREDVELGEFYKERRYVVPYEKIPDIVIKAFISAEDDQFFEHQGVNLISMLRAQIANMRAGSIVQGGSTITQQVAKSLLLTSEKSYIRKIREVILASRIERNLSKQQILYLYLNQINLGHGAYGVQAAAKTYFRKDVSDLSLPEAAILAGMPQAPSKYGPHLNPKKAKDRQLYVLRRMAENGFISQSQMAEAAAKPIRVFQAEEEKQRPGAYLVEHIRRYLLEKYGQDALYEQGLTVAVPTTRELLVTAKKSLRDGLRAVDKRMGYRGAIKRITKSADVAEFIEQQRIELISRRLGYQMFMPDGRLDWLESITDAGFPSETALLEPDELYPAYVAEVDDTNKVVKVKIGKIDAEMPVEHMKWARTVRDDKNPNLVRAEPRLPSQVVDKGDVVHVRLVKSIGGKTVVALDQVPEVQGSLFSVEAQTGYVLAMEGGYDFSASEFNRASQAQRQQGSCFKPILYSAALEKGFTPASIIVDSPIVYSDETFGKWKPTNFEEKFYGDTTFRQALIKSRNVPTIKIAEAIQVPFAIEYARRLGMTGTFASDLSISLGSGTSSLLELTSTYSLFPRLGRKLNPIFFTSVRDRDGKILEERLPQPFVAPASSPAPVVSAGPPTEPSRTVLGAQAPTGARPAVVIPAYPSPEDPEQVMDPRVAYVMTHLMKEVVNYGTGYEAKSLARPAAGKTGTTSDYLDAWFIGFTPYVSTGVWVGYDSQKPIGPGETGAKASLPIWLNFMKEAVKPYPDSDFPIPPGVIFASIDPTTGKLASANSSFSIREAFIEGTEPTEVSLPKGSTTDSQSDFLKEDIE
jgi:penicillin-binding protein 1A